MSGLHLHPWMSSLGYLVTRSVFYGIEDGVDKFRLVQAGHQSLFTKVGGEVRDLSSFQNIRVRMGRGIRQRYYPFRGMGSSRVSQIMLGDSPSRPYLP